MSNQKAAFTRRVTGSSIPIVMGNCAPEKLLRTVVVDGDSVSLRIGTESVQVNNVEVLSRFGLRGEIYSFLPSHGLDYQGHKLGDIVDFEEQHIFSLDVKTSDN